MAISSRTPDGQPNRCHVCGSELKIEPSDPACDAPCPRCGHLLWFTWEDKGDVEVMKPTEKVLTTEALDAFLDSVAVKPGVHLILDLSEVHYFASAALARLVGIKKRVRSVDGKLTIRHLNPDVLEIFRITRLEHVFDIKP
jgi:HptB-dependent secretion and biofilm anti anti-sigma factor